MSYPLIFQILLYNKIINFDYKMGLLPKKDQNIFLKKKNKKYAEQEMVGQNLMHHRLLLM